MIKNLQLRWANLAIIIGIVAVAYWWINGIPRTTESNTHGSTGIPASGPAQKKVVLKNLGMA